MVAADRGHEPKRRKYTNSAMYVLCTHRYIILCDTTYEVRGQCCRDGWGWGWKEMETRRKWERDRWTRGEMEGNGDGDGDGDGEMVWWGLGVFARGVGMVLASPTQHHCSLLIIVHQSEPLLLIGYGIKKYPYLFL